MHFGNPPLARVACVLDVCHDALAFFVVKDSQNLYHEMKCLKNVLIEFLVFIANTCLFIFEDEELRMLQDSMFSGNTVYNVFCGQPPSEG